MSPRCRRARSVIRIRRKFAFLFWCSDSICVFSPPVHLFSYFVTRAPTRGFYGFWCSVPTGTQKSRHAGACRLTVCDNVLPPQELTSGGLILVQVSSASGCSSSSSWGDASVTGSAASASSSARVMMSTKKSFFLMPRSLR